MEKPPILLQMKSSLSLLQSFTSLHLYNKQLVDPYLMVSHYVKIASKTVYNQDNNSPILLGVCCNSECDLTIQFDNINPNYKGELSSVLQQHDKNCQYKNFNKNIFNFNLFRQYGAQIYKQNILEIQKQAKWIQLMPRQVLKIIKQGNKAHKIYQMFKRLDENLQKQHFSKVKTTIFMAIFGWFFKNDKLKCKFCMIECNVQQYLSPSCFTLMKINEGFDFVGNHRPWCCLIDPNKLYWQQILRQAVIQKLKNTKGEIVRDKDKLKLKQIKQKSMTKYCNEIIPKLNSINVILNKNKEQILQNTKNQSVKNDFRIIQEELQSFLINCRGIAKSYLEQMIL